MRPRRIALPDDTMSGMSKGRKRAKDYEFTPILDSLDSAYRDARRGVGNTSTTHWSGSSGPPVSGGGGGSYSSKAALDREAYLRGRNEMRRKLGYADDPLAAENAKLRKAIIESGDVPAAAADTSERLVKLIKSASPPQSELAAERTCAACGIGEFSRIGAGPFTKDGVCRYCAELNDLASHPHDHEPAYPSHKHKPRDLVAANAKPGSRSGPVQLWPVPLRIIFGLLLLAVAVGTASGLVAGIIELAAVLSGH